jgi:hypothetical protein
MKPGPFIAISKSLPVFFIEPGSKLTEDPWSITKSNLPDPAVLVGAAEYIPSSLLKDVVFMLAILFATSANSLRKALCLDKPTYIEFSILKFYPLKKVPI